MEAAANAELFWNGLRKEEPDISKEESAEFAKRVKQFLVFIEWNIILDEVTDADWKSWL